MISMQVKISGNQVLLVNNSYCAEGFLTFNGNTYTIPVPRQFLYSGTPVIFANSDFDGSVNPSFALEGTYTDLFKLFNIISLWSTGWYGMFINGQWVTYINAVVGYSSATGVGDTATISSYLVESGLTLFHNEFLGVWTNPYVWYFSIG
ncbi:conserved hypothetical protein [Sulfolobus islandicus Y.G.57.14]|uniref:Uncharacterized protein n=1 Tax=Saccharolobus islandicus (strain Y.G.57.14 / Yellowstone \|nr:hypothetical protein [Sulfolobus islandicus]ACP44768.1 conserved hypothetical protein [Sulfolobus islandicus Y.G.57.14]